MSNSIIYSFTAFVVSFACGMMFIPWILDFCKRRGLYDIPNARKIHKGAIPRLGGVAFIPSTLIGLLIVALIASSSGDKQIPLHTWTLFFMMGVGMIYIVGLADDIVGVKARKKLIIQFSAAALLPLSGLWLNNLGGLFGVWEIPMWVGVPLTIFSVAFVSNAVNLIDGIDGLSGGLTLIALTGFAFLCYGRGLTYHVVMIMSLMGVITAYLYYNIFGDETKNRKIFMGDTGSLSIGFMLAFLALKISMTNDARNMLHSMGLLQSMTLLLVPIFDVVRVIFVRICNHRSPMKPDNNHIHHKLMRAGLSTHQTLCVILVLQLLFIGLNFMLMDNLKMTWILIIDIVLYTGIHLLIDVFIRKQGRSPREFFN